MSLTNNADYFEKVYRSFDQSKIGNSKSYVVPKGNTLITAIYETPQSTESFSDSQRDHFSFGSIIQEDTPMSIQDFNRRYGNLRQALALKKIKGELLTNMQSILLNNLNAKIRSLLTSENESDRFKTLKKFIEKYKD